MKILIILGFLIISVYIWEKMWLDTLNISCIFQGYIFDISCILKGHIFIFSPKSTYEILKTSNHIFP